jgi:hypothetical protein
MALAKLTPQCAAAWRHDMPPSTAFSTLSRISSLILLVGPVTAKLCKMAKLG